MSTNLPSLLVLDAELFIRELLKIQLEPLSAKVLFAEDEKEAIKILLARKPELIIMDILHPKMEGYKFGQWFKNEPALEDIKLLILTFKKKDPATFFLYSIWVEAFKKFSQMIHVISTVPEEESGKTQAEPRGNYYLSLPFSGKPLAQLVENILELK